MAENENKQENVVVVDFKRTNAKKSKKTAESGTCFL